MNPNARWIASTIILGSRGLALGECEPFLKKGRRKAGTGGLVDTVSLVNSLVVLTMNFSLGMLFHLAPIAKVAFRVVGFIGSEEILLWFIKRQYGI